MKIEKLSYINKFLTLKTLNKFYKIGTKLAKIYKNVQKLII